MIQRLRPLAAWGMHGLGDSTVDSLAAAIQKMEGYIPPGTPGYPNGSLAYQNNNPGNITYNPNGYNYPGCVPNGRFCSYPDYATGEAALQHQIQVQIDSGQNLTQFFNQYAPSNENNTANYVSFVSQQTGFDPTVALVNYQSGSAATSDSSSGPLADMPTYNPADSTPVNDSLASIATADTTTLVGVGLGLAVLLYAVLG